MTYLFAPKSTARLWPLPWAMALLAAACSSHAETDITENDFFEPVPVVLTVSRLAQSLHDTPGALTLLDREVIRQSGARTLADLLRLVPGYMVSGFNGANPVVAYHAPLDEYGARNLVLVDGRSLYSTAHFSGTINGMLSVMLDDVERIEVLRGSNSAAYGANALFGVINVVTRHSADTLGGAASVSVGEASMGDAMARLGWGNAAASHRLSVQQRKDSGYQFVHDDTLQHGLQWRSDLRLGAHQELLLTAGYADRTYGLGVPNSFGDPQRDANWQQAHVLLNYTRHVSDDEKISLSFSWDEERIRDAFVYQQPGFPPGIVVSKSVDGRRWNLEYQHQRRLSGAVRAVWGVGLKQDAAQSMSLFATPEWLEFLDTRAFGNLEWRLSGQWLLNVGVFAGHHSATGAYANPRLMFNYQIAPDHTLRFGVSQAHRSISLLERHANVRFYDGSGRYVTSTFVASGTATPEQLSSTEVSYYGRFAQANVTFDARAYEERFTDEVKATTVAGGVMDFLNRRGSVSRGAEFQLKWQPVAQTELIWNQSYTRLHRNDGTNERMPPEHMTSIGWMQRLPQAWDVSLWLHSRSGMMWRSANAPLGAAERVDVRLARRFQWGGARAEAALTVQALNGDQVEFTSRERSVLQRRAYATLRLEY